MSRIDIRHPHSLSKAKARKAVEDVARKLAEKFDMDYGWEGDTLNFSRSGVDGHIATHTMRKSFVRLNYEHFGMPLAVLMRALNHSSEKQTLDYVGMLPKDIERLYENSI